jgi:DNA-binding MarR family transcriptional regulator
MVSLIDRLERKGLVERRRRSEDRRANELQVTPTGERTVAGARQAMEEAEREFLDSLSETDRRRLRELLRRLAT